MEKILLYPIPNVRTTSGLSANDCSNLFAETGTSVPVSVGGSHALMMAAENKEIE